jgi:hypothetical protein
MRDARPKKRKPLTPREQFKNLCDALAEDALSDTTPLTKAEQLEAERTKERVLARAEATDSDWRKKERGRKGGSKTNYIN